LKYSVRPRYFYSFIDALSEIARIEILYALTTAWAKLYQSTLRIRHYLKGSGQFGVRSGQFAWQS